MRAVRNGRNHCMTCRYYKRMLSVQGDNCLCVGEERTGIKLLLEKLHKIELLDIYFLHITVRVINK